MKKIVQENQFVLSKMETPLNCSANRDTPFSSPDWFLSSKRDLVILRPSYALASEIPIVPKDHLSISHQGHFQCTICKKSVKKLYSGYCYICLTQKASADMCVMNPQKCHFSQGTCREPQWGLDFCYEPHYVYIAFTDKYKVGITRKAQLLTRWVDQGATMAAPLCLVSSRHQAGVLEKALMEIMSDKSHWQKMLKSGNDCPSEDEFMNKLIYAEHWLRDSIQKNPSLVLPMEKEVQEKNKNKLPSEIYAPITFLEQQKITQIQYPLGEPIDKIKSISLEKLKEFKGEVTGIKGQYLFFGDQVFNVRSHEGFVVNLERY